MEFSKKFNYVRKHEKAIATFRQKIQDDLAKKKSLIANARAKIEQAKILLRIQNHERQIELQYEYDALESIINSEDSKDSISDSKDSIFNSKDSSNEFNSKDSISDAYDYNFDALESVETIMDLESMGLNSYESLHKRLTKLDGIIDRYIEVIKNTDREQKKISEYYAVKLVRQKIQYDELTMLLKPQSPKNNAGFGLGPILWSNFSIQNFLSLFFCLNGLIYLMSQLFGH